MGVRAGMMIAEPIGEAIAASPMMAVTNHFVGRGYWYGSTTSGTIENRARRPLRLLLGTFPGYLGDSLVETRDICRDSACTVVTALGFLLASRSTSLPCTCPSTVDSGPIEIVEANEWELSFFLSPGDMSLFSVSSISSSKISQPAH
jgi:hypothetical protein